MWRNLIIVIRPHMVAVSILSDYSMSWYDSGPTETIHVLQFGGWMWLDTITSTRNVSLAVGPKINFILLPWRLLQDERNRMYREPRMQFVTVTVWLLPALSSLSLLRLQVNVLGLWRSTRDDCAATTFSYNTTAIGDTLALGSSVKLEIVLRMQPFVGKPNHRYIPSTAI